VLSSLASFAGCAFLSSRKRYDHPTKTPRAR